MINDFYYSSRNQLLRSNSSGTSGFSSGSSGSASSVTTVNQHVGYGFRSSVPVLSSVGSGGSSSSMVSPSMNKTNPLLYNSTSETCPIGQSRVVQELTMLHSQLVQYLKNMPTTSNNSNVCFTSPSKYSTPMVCDLNFACSRFTSNSYSSEGIGNPLLMNTQPSSPYSPVRSSVATSFSTSSPQSYSNSSFQSNSLSLNEYEERISKLEQLVKQILNLIYRGDYKSPSDKTSVQIQQESNSKQLLTNKIKETYQLDMEPLKQIVASVVHFEPKRLNMAYDIIFQIKTELAYLSQL